MALGDPAWGPTHERLMRQVKELQEEIELLNIELEHALKMEGMMRSAVHEQTARADAAEEKYSHAMEPIRQQDMLLDQYRKGMN